MGKKSKEKKGGTEEAPAVVNKSFDSELDALFRGAGSVLPTTTTASTKARSVAAAATSTSGGDVESEEPFEANDEDEELSSINSDTVISGISDDESEGGLHERGTVERDTSAKQAEEEEESDDGAVPVHETVSNPSLLLNGRNGNGRPTKRKLADREEPQAQKDARSLFIGNLPVHLATSKTSLKALRKHLIACSPYPTITQIESIRFRSIPFSKPTDDYEARNPNEAEEGSKKRQRSQKYKDSLSETSSQKKSFLSGSQKRKVAYINHEINDKADCVNAYVTLSHISPVAVEQLNSEKGKDVTSLTAQALAALLAVSVNGTLFEERHLRADLVVPLLPADILDTGLISVKTADGSLLGASAGATSIDNESRKRTIFVGNLDFEAKEEELRDFFESLVTRERGSPPEVKALDFSQSDKLPMPEEQQEDEELKRLPSWVYGVRIIRDAATQMGKGFGYVRFLDAASVDEVMAIHESEQNALNALKAGKSINRDFRRKLKYKGRALRLSRCKVSKGNVTPSTSTLTPKRPTITVPQRSRSSGAPTPGGSSPFLRKQQQQQQQQQSASYASPTRKSKGVANGITTVPNPAPQHSDPLKTARNAQKRADVERQARRMAKKNRKRAERTRDDDGGDKGRIKIKIGKAGKSGNKFKKVARLGTLAMMSMMMLLSIFIPPAMANTEIVNFGPVYCRAEEIGHLEDRAARQVSQSWPTLTPSSKPTLFSLNPSTQKDGVWLVLDLTAEEGTAEAATSTSTITAESLATRSFPLLFRSTHSSASEGKLPTPRDEWIRRTKNHIIWKLFTKRYQFRVNYAANFAINVDATVHSARSMLKKGKITWKTDDLDKDMETLQQDEDLIGVDVPMWPCPRLYVHIEAEEFGVIIPPRQKNKEEDKGLFWKWIFEAADVYIGPLMSKPKKDSEATALIPIPVHLVFEPLYLGFIPQTSLTLLAVLIPLLTFVYFFVLPSIEAAFQSLANEERIKTE